MLAVAVLLGRALAPGGAAANPAILYVDGGAGGALLPRGTADVRIVSERLEFTEHAREDAAADWQEVRRRLPWHVRADYVLENLTDVRLEAEVGFPVAGDRGSWDQNAAMDADPESGEPLVWWPSGRALAPFDGSFHVRLDDRELRQRTVHNECPVDASGDPPVTPDGVGFCYPDVFVFQVVLEAHATAALTVEYDQVPAMCCEPDYALVWADYILETGALWAGSIGRLDIIYRFAVPPLNGVRVFDRLVGPLLPAQGPWRSMSQEGAPGGISRRAQPVAAPAGVLDLWEPAVRFHYAFACRNGSVVLRLKATDVEPRGNLSLGLTSIEERLDGMADGAGYRELERLPCAATRSAEPEPWERWRQRAWSETGFKGGDVDELPPDWSCSFVRRGTEFRFDCCCAAAAEDGRWNPDCDKPGQAGGRGCAAGADLGRPPAPTPAAAGTTGAADAATAPDAAGPDAAAAGVVAAQTDATEPSPADAAAAVEPSTLAPDATSTAQSGGGAETGRGAPVSSAAQPAVDASATPAGSPPKKGCGCVVAGTGGAAGAGLAALAVLLLARRSRRR
jgi:MYXO-CTERM domain-containing protein